MRKFVVIASVVAALAASSAAFADSTVLSGYGSQGAKAVIKVKSATSAKTPTASTTPAATSGTLPFTGFGPHALRCGRRRSRRSRLRSSAVEAGLEQLARDITEELGGGSKLPPAELPEVRTDHFAAPTVTTNHPVSEGSPTRSLPPDVQAGRTDHVYRPGARVVGGETRVPATR